jgi:hypothetical protein
MFTTIDSQKGGQAGGQIACNIEYYCEQCDQHFKGPIYFRHLKSKRHARITHLLNLHRNTLLDNSNE